MVIKNQSGTNKAGNSQLSVSTIILFAQAGAAKWVGMKRESEDSDEEGKVEEKTGWILMDEFEN